MVLVMVFVGFPEFASMRTVFALYVKVSLFFWTYWCAASAHYMLLLLLLLFCPLLSWHKSSSLLLELSKLSTKILSNNTAQVSTLPCLTGFCKHFQVKTERVWKLSYVSPITSRQAMGIEASDQNDEFDDRQGTNENARPNKVQPSRFALERVIRRKPRRFLVLGLAGSGKSTLINMLLNDSAYRQDMTSPAPVGQRKDGPKSKGMFTTYFNFELNESYTEMNGVGEHSYSLGHVAGVLKQLVQFCMKGFDGIVLVLRGIDPLSSPARRNIKFLELLCGEGWQKSTILVYTHAPHGMTRARLLQLYKYQADPTPKLLSSIQEVVFVNHELDAIPELEVQSYLDRVKGLVLIKQMLKGFTERMKPPQENEWMFRLAKFIFVDARAEGQAPIPDKILWEKVHSIKGHWKRKFGTCLVCQEAIKASFVEGVALVPCCSRTFHDACLVEREASGSRDCPNCGKRLPSESSYPCSPDLNFEFVNSSILPRAASISSPEPPSKYHSIHKLRQSQPALPPLENGVSAPNTAANSPANSCPATPLAVSITPSPDMADKSRTMDKLSPPAFDAQASPIPLAAGANTKPAKSPVLPVTEAKQPLQQLRPNCIRNITDSFGHSRASHNTSSHSHATHNTVSSSSQSRTTHNTVSSSSAASSYSSSSAGKSEPAPEAKLLPQPDLRIISPEAARSPQPGTQEMDDIVDLSTLPSGKKPAAHNCLTISTFSPPQPVNESGEGPASFNLSLSPSLQSTIRSLMPGLSPAPTLPGDPVSERKGSPKRVAAESQQPASKKSKSGKKKKKSTKRKKFGSKLAPEFIPASALAAASAAAGANSATTSALNASTAPNHSSSTCPKICPAQPAHPAQALSLTPLGQNTLNFANHASGPSASLLVSSKPLFSSVALDDTAATASRKSLRAAGSTGSSKSPATDKTSPAQPAHPAQALSLTPLGPNTLNLANDASGPSASLLVSSKPLFSVALNDSAAPASSKSLRAAGSTGSSKSPATDKTSPAQPAHPAQVLSLTPLGPNTLNVANEASGPSASLLVSSKPLFSSVALNDSAAPASLRATGSTGSSKSPATDKTSPAQPAHPAQALSLTPLGPNTLNVANEASGPSASLYDTAPTSSSVHKLLRAADSTGSSKSPATHGKTSPAQPAHPVQVLSLTPLGQNTLNFANDVSGPAASLYDTALASSAHKSFRAAGSTGGSSSPENHGQTSPAQPAHPAQVLSLTPLGQNTLNVANDVSGPSASLHDTAAASSSVRKSLRAAGSTGSSISPVIHGKTSPTQVLSLTPLGQNTNAVSGPSASLQEVSNLLSSSSLCHDDASNNKSTISKADANLSFHTQIYQDAHLDAAAAPTFAANSSCQLENTITDATLSSHKQVYRDARLDAVTSCLDSSDASLASAPQTASAADPQSPSVPAFTASAADPQSLSMPAFESGHKLSRAAPRAVSMGAKLSPSSSKPLFLSTPMSLHHGELSHNQSCTSTITLANPRNESITSTITLANLSSRTPVHASVALDDTPASRKSLRAADSTGSSSSAWVKTSPAQPAHPAEALSLTPLGQNTLNFANVSCPSASLQEVGSSSDSKQLFLSSPSLYHDDNESTLTNIADANLSSHTQVYRDARLDAAAAPTSIPNLFDASHNESTITVADSSSHAQVYRDARLDSTIPTSARNLFDAISHNESTMNLTAADLSSHTHVNTSARYGAAAAPTSALKLFAENSSSPATHGKTSPVQPSHPAQVLSLTPLGQTTLNFANDASSEPSASLQEVRSSTPPPLARLPTLLSASSSLSPASTSSPAAQSTTPPPQLPTLLSSSSLPSLADSKLSASLHTEHAPADMTMASRAMTASFSSSLISPCRMSASLIASPLSCVSMMTQSYALSPPAEPSFSTASLKIASDASSSSARLLPACTPVALASDTAGVGMAGKENVSAVQPPRAHSVRQHSKRASSRAQSKNKSASHDTNRQQAASGVNGDSIELHTGKRVLQDLNLGPFERKHDVAWTQAKPQASSPSRGQSEQQSAGVINEDEIGLHTGKRVLQDLNLDQLERKDDTIWSKAEPAAKAVPAAIPSEPVEADVADFKLAASLKTPAPTDASHAMTASFSSSVISPCRISASLIASPLSSISMTQSYALSPPAEPSFSARSLPAPFALASATAGVGMAGKENVSAMVQQPPRARSVRQHSKRTSSRAQPKSSDRQGSQQAVSEAERPSQGAVAAVESATAAAEAMSAVPPAAARNRPASHEKADMQQPAIELQTGKQVVQDLNLGQLERKDDVAWSQAKPQASPASRAQSKKSPGVKAVPAAISSGPAAAEQQSPAPTASPPLVHVKRARRRPGLVHDAHATMPVFQPYSSPFKDQSQQLPPAEKTAHKENQTPSTAHTGERVSKDLNLGQLERKDDVTWRQTKAQASSLSQGQSEKIHTEEQAANKDQTPSTVNASLPSTVEIGKRIVPDLNPAQLQRNDDVTLRPGTIQVSSPQKGQHKAGQQSQQAVRKGVAWSSGPNLSAADTAATSTSTAHSTAKSALEQLQTAAMALGKRVLQNLNQDQLQRKDDVSWRQAQPQTDKEKSPAVKAVRAAIPSGPVAAEQQSTAPSASPPLVHFKRARRRPGLVHDAQATVPTFQPYSSPVKAGTATVPSFRPVHTDLFASTPTQHALAVRGSSRQGSRRSRSGKASKGSEERQDLPISKSKQGAEPPQPSISAKSEQQAIAAEVVSTEDEAGLEELVNALDRSLAAQPDPLETSTGTLQRKAGRHSQQAVRQGEIWTTGPEIHDADSADSEAAAASKLNTAEFTGTRHQGQRRPGQHSQKAVRSGVIWTTGPEMHDADVTDSNVPATSKLNTAEFTGTRHQGQRRARDRSRQAVRQGVIWTTGPGLHDAEAADSDAAATSNTALPDEAKALQEEGESEEEREEEDDDEDGPVGSEEEPLEFPADLDPEASPTRARRATMAVIEAWSVIRTEARSGMPAKVYKDLWNNGLEWQPLFHEKLVTLRFDKGRISAQIAGCAEEEIGWLTPETTATLQTRGRSRHYRIDKTFRVHLSFPANSYEERPCTIRFSFATQKAARDFWQVLSNAIEEAKSQGEARICRDASGEGTTWEEMFGGKAVTVHIDQLRVLATLPARPAANASANDPLPKGEEQEVAQLHHNASVVVPGAGARRFSFVGGFLPPVQQDGVLVLRFSGENNSSCFPALKFTFSDKHIAQVFLHVLSARIKSLSKGSSRRRRANRSTRRALAPLSQAMPGKLDANSNRFLQMNNRRANRVL
eukprot:g4058.t1